MTPQCCHAKLQLQFIKRSPSFSVRRNLLAPRKRTPSAQTRCLCQDILLIAEQRAPTDTQCVAPCQHQGHRLFQSPAPWLCLSSIHQSPNRHKLSPTKMGKVSSRMRRHVCVCVRVCAGCNPRWVLLSKSLTFTYLVPKLYTQMGARLWLEVAPQDRLFNLS